jgi:hypothetical protein
MRGSPGRYALGDAIRLVHGIHFTQIDEFMIIP